eukprot:4183673-Amphidinium_carterae.2
MAKLHKMDGRTPQVAIAATKYELNAEEKRAFVQTPIETSLRFTIKEEGARSPRAGALTVAGRQGSLESADQLSGAMWQRSMGAKGGRSLHHQALCLKFVKQLAPDAFEQVVECWKPKLLAGPTILMKVKATNASKVASKLTEAGFSVTPSRAVQDGTKVAWTKAESLEDATKLAKEVLKDMLATKKLDGTETPWTRESALFIKGSTGRAGQARFGLRLPAEYYATVQERLGRDVRKMYTIAGAPRGWMQDDIENCIPILDWEGEVKYASRGQWFVRAAADPGRWTAVVGSGYE